MNILRITTITLALTLLVACGGGGGGTAAAPTPPTNMPPTVVLPDYAVDAAMARTAVSGDAPPSMTGMGIITEIQNRATAADTYDIKHSGRKKTLLHRRYGEIGAFLDAGRPTRGDGLEFGVETNAVHSVLVHVAEGGTFPTAETIIGQRHGNGNIHTYHAHSHPRGCRRQRRFRSHGRWEALWLLQNWEHGQPEGRDRRFPPCKIAFRR